MIMTTQVSLVWPGDMIIGMIMGVNGAPSTPSGEGVGVGHKMALVTKWRKEKKGEKKKRGKRKKGKRSDRY